LSFLIYVETNWIVGAVMGQDSRAEDLLSASEANVYLALPAVCVMEAISAFDWKGNFKDFEKEPVSALLAEAGIKQFNSTDRVLGWIGAG